MRSEAVVTVSKILERDFNALGAFGSTAQSFESHGYRDGDTGRREAAAWERNQS